MNRSEKSTLRNSSVETLKIFAMFLIVLSHILPSMGTEAEYDINLYAASSELSNIMLVIFNYFGQIGNCIFVICSAYFLSDSKRFKPEKAFEFVWDNWLISILFLLAFVVLHVSLPVNTIIRQIFPLTFNNNWYVACYLMFYCIHPWLNHIVDSLSQKSHFYVVILMLISYSIINLILPGDINFLYYNTFIGFIELYFVVSYMKKYDFFSIWSIHSGISTAIVSFVLLVLLIAMTNFLELRMTLLSESLMHWNSFVNPLIMSFSLSLFQIALKHAFYKPLVNYVSSLTLYIYVIHRNRLVHTYLRPVYFQYIYEHFGYDYIVAWCLGLSMLIFGISIVIALIYRHFIQRLIKPVSFCVYNGGRKLLQNAFRFSRML